MESLFGVQSGVDTPGLCFMFFPTLADECLTCFPEHVAVNVSPCRSWCSDVHQGAAASVLRVLTEGIEVKEDSASCLRGLTVAAENPTNRASDN